MFRRIADIRQERLHLMLDLAAFLAARGKQCRVAHDDQLALHEERHRLRLLDHCFDRGLRQIEGGEGKILLIPVNQPLLEQANELLNLIFFRAETYI
ncbi:hypothetical protein D3C76_1621420 [compost metagenome]